jgi:hypothetical protein
MSKTRAEKELKIESMTRGLLPGCGERPPRCGARPESARWSVDILFVSQLKSHLVQLNSFGRFHGRVVVDLASQRLAQLIFLLWKAWPPMRTTIKDRIISAVLILLFLTVIAGSAYFVLKTMTHWRVEGLGMVQRATTSLSRAL